MANWGVVLARKPMVARKQKSQNHQRHLANHTGSGSPEKLHELQHHASVSPSFTRHGHVFKHLCKPEDGDEHDCYKLGCERLTINVSGLHFITRRSVLEAHPTTLLGKAFGGIHFCYN